MRTLLYILTLSFAATMIAGCDSNDEESDSDADILVGSWELESISDDQGDKTQVFFSEADGVEVVFAAAGTFSLSMDYNAAGETAGFTDVALAGTYSVNESAKSLTLTVTALGATLPGSYSIIDRNQVRISAQAALLNALFGGTPNVGTTRITLRRQ